MIIPSAFLCVSHVLNRNDEMALRTAQEQYQQPTIDLILRCKVGDILFLSYPAHPLDSSPPVDDPGQDNQCEKMDCYTNYSTFCTIFVI